jgi:hypothetical protein
MKLGEMLAVAAAFAFLPFAGYYFVVIAAILGGH